MVCIYCGAETSVTNSRKQIRKNDVWRRRVCDQCQATVTTIEKINLETALVVTSQNAHERFSRDRLFISIYESCKHRNDAQRSATALTDTVIALLYPLIHDASITRADIVKTTVDVLHHFDKPASVHYKAFHPVKK
jgi:transcriptional regulator NrdR family protein